jgi:hypothetical protein
MKTDPALIAAGSESSREIFMRHFLHDDPDVKISLYELAVIKKLRQEFLRLKGYKPPESWDIDTLRKQAADVRQAGG